MLLATDLAIEHEFVNHDSRQTTTTTTIVVVVAAGHILELRVVRQQGVTTQ